MLSLVASVTCRAATRVATPHLIRSVAIRPTLFFSQARTMSVKYTPEHEWVKVDGDVATVGITDYAQDSLGDIVYVELDEADTELGEGDVCGAVESVKAASDIYSPLTGVVVEINADLADEPGTINTDPMGEGWLLKIKMANTAELDALMDDAAYSKFCKSEDDKQ